MRRSWLCLAVLPVAVSAVEIVPPSPYMSSPPPAMADTTVVDPGRKPKTVTVEPGTDEVWYADWSLVGDRPTSAEVLAIKAPRQGRRTFRAAFNDHGWPTEVSYFDAKGNMKWTKLFRYPTRIPSGPGDVPFTTTWISSKGGAINLAKVSESYRSGNWHLGQRKYEVSDRLGEPLLVESGESGLSGSAETWVYLVDGKEVRFAFDKNNSLLALPGEPAPAAVVPAAVTKPDTAKSKPAASAPETGAKPKARKK